MSNASDVWAKIKSEIHDRYEAMTWADLEEFDKFAIREIEKVAVSDIEPVAQADNPRVDFFLDKKADGTPLLVAVSAVIRKPEYGKAKIDQDHAMVVRYLNGSVNISTAKVPL